MFLPGFHSDVFMGDITCTREKWKRLNRLRESFTSLTPVRIYLSSLQHQCCGTAAPRTPPMVLGSMSRRRYSSYTFTIPSIFFSECTVSFYPLKCLRYLCTSHFLKFPQPDSGRSTHSVASDRWCSAKVPGRGGQRGVTLPPLASGRHCVLLEKGVPPPSHKENIRFLQCVPLGCILLERTFILFLKHKSA